MNNKILASLGITTVLAFFAVAIWRAEITYKEGWKSLDWLYDFYSISPWIITLLVTFAVFTPFYIEKNEPNLKHLIKPFIAIFIIGIISYNIAHIQMFALMFGSGSYVLGLIALLNGILFYFIVNRYVAKVPIFYGFLVVLAVAAPLFQGSLFGGNIVDDVKEGFPFFFIVLNLGVLSTFMVYYLNRSKVNSEELNETNLV